MRPVSVAAVLLAVACARGAEAPPAATGSGRYADLTSLFTEWRAFQTPPLTEGVPDYSAQAMATQHRGLAAFQDRLRAINAAQWPVAEQIDYHIVRAEMNGLDFDHRVLQPWARDPAFYRAIFLSQSDVPAREGPVVRGAIEVWQYQFPLSAEAATDLSGKLRIIPRLLQQARLNLVGNAKDLWIQGARTIRSQAADLSALAQRIAGNVQLQVDVQDAKAATESFADWLDAEAPSKTGPSGVGKENYNWYLHHVHLVPYTWDDLVAIMRRELARSLAGLALEEARNRRLPEPSLIASGGEYNVRFNAAVTQYLQFLRERKIVPMRDYMDAALRERIGRFSAPGTAPREFFSQIDYRDPVVMRTHGYHWFDLARMRIEPHTSPIRRLPLLYNIFDTRAEGMATGMEEMMMHAGLFDARPRTRELIWILLAQRAARAMGDLTMHANEGTFDEAIAYAAQWTPRGWLPVDGATVRGEQHLYLQQPFYGSSYIVGKIMIEQLLGEQAKTRGAEFALAEFLDAFNGSGMVPVSLIRWELTGDSSEVARMAATDTR